MERDPRLRAVEIREYTGNSEATARKHYSTVTREDRQQAATDWPEQSSGPTVDDGSHQKASDRTAKETGLPRTRRKERSELIRTDSEKNKVHPEGFEPPTLGSEDRCSIQLSYGCVLLPRFYLLSRLRLDRNIWVFSLSIIPLEKMECKGPCLWKIITRAAGSALCVASRGGPANVAIARVSIPTRC